MKQRFCVKLLRDFTRERYNAFSFEVFLLKMDFIYQSLILQFCNVWN